jgi:hypothetical protein
MNARGPAQAHRAGSTAQPAVISRFRAVAIDLRLEDPPGSLVRWIGCGGPRTARHPEDLDAIAVSS